MLCCSKTARDDEFLVGSWCHGPRTAGSSYAEGVFHRVFLHPRVALPPCIVLIFVCASVQGCRACFLLRFVGYGWCKNLLLLA